MLDFENPKYLKLKTVDPKEVLNVLNPILTEDEEIVEAFKSVRDMVVFTNKRVISVNVQGVTGKKKDFTSMPYRKIQAYSIETPGTFDLDCEMDLYFSSVGRVHFEFSGKADIRGINRIISKYIL